MNHRRLFLVPLVFALAGWLMLLVGAAILVPHMGVYAAGLSVLNAANVQQGQQANVNQNCSLVVPAQPLTAQGLATPYQLVATNPGDGPCNEANKMQAAFVQAAVLDPVAGTISIYNPLVVDQGTQPAAPPVVPTLPPGAVVGIWFGFNGNTLTLQDANGSLQAGNCVNGINGSVFGQFAYCNAPAFFQAANQAIAGGQLVPPPLGTAKDGQACPTVRDFSVVDQDQSDNVTTTYLVTANGQTAQSNAANAAALQNVQAQVNGSDNRLLAVALDTALGCTPWMAPDLADQGKMVTALPLNELQAAAQQAQPIALVPAFDPMVLVNKQPNIGKMNAYRVGVDQGTRQQQPSIRNYCTNLRAIGPARIALDAPLTKMSPSPDQAVANSLFTFLAQRFVTTYEANGLNCMQVLGQPDPVTVQADGNGVAIAAMINTPGAAPVAGTPSVAGAMSCVVNGKVIPGCLGTATINGQLCAIVLDAATRQVNITCPGQ